MGYLQCLPMGKLSTCRVNILGEMVVEEEMEGNLISKENPLCQKTKRSAFKWEDCGRKINGMLNLSNHKKLWETFAHKTNKEITLIDPFVV